MRCNGFTVVSAIVVVFVITLSTAATVSAFDYYTNKPLYFIYQTGNGNWKGCGPVQCLSTSWKPQAKAVDMLLHEAHGESGYRIGTYGKCDVYQTDGELGPGDKDPEWVIARMQKYCN